MDAITNKITIMVILDELRVLIFSSLLVMSEANQYEVRRENRADARRWSGVVRGGAGWLKSVLIN